MKNKISVAIVAIYPEQDVQATVDSCAPYVDDIVICGANFASKISVGKNNKVHLSTITPESHPSAFKIDSQETWEGTGLEGPFTGQPILVAPAILKQTAYDLCSHDFRMWLDAGDVVEGGENLSKLVDVMRERSAPCSSMNYDWAKDENGNVTCSFRRERKIQREICFAKWEPHVHEALQGIKWIVHCPDVNVVRKSSTPSLFRDHVKILKAWWRDHGHDESYPQYRRLLFYLGKCEFELDSERAVDILSRYCEITDWPEEKAIAHLMIGQHWENRGSYDQAALQFEKAVQTYPGNPDGKFALARVAYFEGDWARCVSATEEALAIVGNSEEMLFKSIVSRNGKPYLYYSYALMKLGSYKEATQACLEGLKTLPEDIYLKMNLRTCLDQR